MKNFFDIDTEVELPEVKPEDRMLVRNVLYSIVEFMKTNSECISWSVNVHSTGYIINVHLSSSFLIGLDELQQIKNVSLTRVEWVGIKSANLQNMDDRKIGCIVCAKVCNEQQAVKVTESEIVRVVCKKRSWMQSIM